MAPSRLTDPNVGFIPKMPQKLAGLSTDPPVWVPRESIAVPAATAAAEKAKRRMAEELGLEYESPSSDISVVDTTVSDSTAEEFVAKEPLNINIGLAASAGLLSGETFTNIPTGVTVVLTTPYGFKLGPFDYTVSLGFGSYTGNYDPSDEDEPTVEFNPVFFGLGGGFNEASATAPI